MASFNGPKLTNPIRTDVPDTQGVLVALAKQDPTSISDTPVGAKRLYEVSSGKWQWQLYNGTSWAPVPFLQHNVDQLDGYHAAITPAANTVAVRNADKKLEGDITGNAATASSAATLSETLPVNKGGTGATISEAARSNLGVPPTSHTSTATTYGVGNATQYGHLKLSDATDSASGVSGGVAATPAAAKAAKDAADAAQSSADAAMTKASTLATSSTPGIVKPGTGLQIGEEGAMNVVAEQTGCLPLTGGTMTGEMSFPRGRIGSSTTLEFAYVTARTDTKDKDDGACLRLESGAANGGKGGNFNIVTRGIDGIEGPALIGTRDGYLIWNGSDTLLPVGAIFEFAANANPSGCLICSGAAVSRTTYARLFNVIGTTYGSGDGSTTFNLPDLIGRYIEGHTTAGIYIEAGLPNIEGTLFLNGGGDLGITMGAFWQYTDQAGKSHEAGSGDATPTIKFDASRSNSIYGNSVTVQPPALTMRYYIKY